MTRVGGGPSGDDRGHGAEIEIEIGKEAAGTRTRGAIGTDTRAASKRTEKTKTRNARRRRRMSAGACSQAKGCVSSCTS